jgi:hypothetical protein
MHLFSGIILQKSEKILKILLTKPLPSAKLFISIKKEKILCLPTALHTHIFAFIIITQRNVIKVICAGHFQG